jgi:hypothetical protein
MIWFARNPSGRATIVWSLAFFAVLYAPFFASRGFADRFDYAPSLAIGLVLASAIVDLSKRSLATAVIALIVLLAFYEAGVAIECVNGANRAKSRGVSPERFLLGVRTRPRERLWLSQA